MKVKIKAVIFSLALCLLAISAFLLLNKVKDSQEKLNQAADIIESLGNTSFSIDANISDSIDISTTFSIPASIPVHVLMYITVNAPLNLDVPVTRSMNLPYSITINEIMPVDTFFSFPEGIHAEVNDTIPIDDRLKIKFWLGMRIPFLVKGFMPLKQTLNLSPGKMRVASNIPVHLQLNDSLPVYLDFSVNVKDTLPMSFTVDADAQITFYTSLPVKGRIPLQMNTPVKIDFSKTPLKAKFDSLAKVMRKIL